VCVASCHRRKLQIFGKELQAPKAFNLRVNVSHVAKYPSECWMAKRREFWSTNLFDTLDSTPPSSPPPVMSCELVAA
jgi:hypothetical protein